MDQRRDSKATAGDSIPRARRVLIERIAARARSLGGSAHERDRLGQFLREYYRGVAEEDLAARAELDLAAAARHHLELGTRRGRNESIVAAFNPTTEREGFDSTRTYVAVVTDDMPFLVDTLGVVFTGAGVGVHLIVHPVLRVRRDARGRLQTLDAEDDRSRAESWQLIEIDRQTDDASLRALEESIRKALGDVRRVVRDFGAMRERMRERIAALEHTPRGVAADEASESRALLQWMEQAHFVFLGYRYYRLRRAKNSDRLVADPTTGLGILSVRGRAHLQPMVLKGETRRIAHEPRVLVLTKANSQSTVHRAGYLDYVGVKDYDASGRIVGEHRFIGLWTSTAYHRSPRDIPLLRRKVELVAAHFGLDPNSHDGKAVLSVLETCPRDELFQASVDDLIHLSRAVVNLYERRNVRLLVRRDPFGRFYSCMAYVPRDRYSTDVRQRIERIVLDAFGGTNLESQVQISESSHARVHMLVRTAESSPRSVDIAALEAAIARETRTWSDRLHDALAQRHDDPTARALAARYAAAFPLSYQDDVSPGEMLEDVVALESLRADASTLKLNLHRVAGASATRMHLRIVKRGEPIPISDLLPAMENFGLRVIAEHPYELGWPEGGAAWVQDFEFEHRDGAQLDTEKLEPRFAEAFLAVWRGEVENDGFNRLLVAAGLASRQIVVLRAYCRYLLQTGVPFSQTSMERTLANNPKIAAALVRLFEQSFDPSGPRSRDARLEQASAAIRASLDRVSSADDDRILRGFLAVMRATLRTNFFQRDAKGAVRPCVSLKFDPHKIPDLPLPRPKFEIFVYSPRVEGVHLRMAYVARGGLRWSDRRDDFRTEVLGLMKAQNVKNTLIVPAGAKGGFFPKRLPVGGSRDDIQREGVAAYQTFINGLLDVTDNIVGEKIVPPANTVRHDGDDAYLVVAADKGTATFSDIANAISVERGFWLGDAFASGGSAGYDHKAMGITARGAWECVKRHFRELGLDTQAEPFTVAGIGDMSGDVFGNGMLLSKHTRLVAAFNHQHVFLDPEPDAAKSFAERERLFNLPRSTWDDYERKLISKGGGIFLRSAKSIPLSAEVQKLLGLATNAATPNEVIRAILRMPVDLLWNGGIGTYVRASSETNLDIGDRSNDAVRVTGTELRARVVGEGGNLGFSQRGRIEYALAGGRINTDFIDNSAGVNTSDVEVNLKILLNPLERSGKLTRARRNQLLRSMTRDVAQLVLRNNYLQSQAISTLEVTAASRLAEYQHVIRSLERSGDLNREIEFLPNDEEIAARAKRGLGLTRPELAVILAYSKIWLSHHLLESDVPEDPYLSRELERYFPRAARERFGRSIPRHRLRREIIVTATTNSLVNRMGPTFVARAQEETGADPAEIARAYTIARETFDMRDLWADIEALDNRAPAAQQYRMMSRSSRALRHLSYWLLAQRRGSLQVERVVDEFRRGVKELRNGIESLLEGADRARFDAALKELRKADVPSSLAMRIASLEALVAAFDIVEVARDSNIAVAEAARVWFRVSSRTGIDWLRQQIDELQVDGPWQAVARTGLRDSASRVHRRIAERVLASRGRGTVDARVEQWIASLGKHYAQWQRTLEEMRAAGRSDFATLSVGIETVRKLTGG